MEFFVSHDLPFCLFSGHVWPCQRHPALPVTVLCVFVPFAAPEVSLTSSNDSLLSPRAKSGERARSCSQDSRGAERVKCPAWGCRSPHWSVVLNVRFDSSARSC